MVEMAAAKVLVIVREMAAATEADSENVTEAAEAHAMAQAPGRRMEPVLINNT